MAGERPAATLQDLGPALVRCFRPPDRSEGLAITLRFSLNSGGGLIGRPIVTFSKLGRDSGAAQAFVTAAFAALAACTPVPVTPALGGAIAGRPLSVRFLGGAPRTAI